MAISERVQKAFRATRALGIPDEEVKPVLKELWKVFDKNWEPIEAEDYRALIDAYFEFKENKGVEDKKKGVMEHDVSKRPSKRPYLGAQEDQASSTRDNSSQMLALEEDGMSMQTYGQDIMESSDPCLRDRLIESSSSLPYTQLSDKVKNPLLSHVPSGDIKSTSGRASGALYFKQPMDEPGSSHSLRESVPSFEHNKDLIKPKSKQSINNLEHFSEPIQMVLPALPASLEGPSTGNNSEKSGSNFVIASLPTGEVKLSLNCDSAFGKPYFQAPKFDAVVRYLEDKYLRSYKLVEPQFSVKKLLKDLCSSFLELGSNSSHRTVTNISSPEVITNRDNSLHARGPNRRASVKSETNSKATNSSRFSNSFNSVNAQQRPIIHDEKMPFREIRDITKGTEKVKISLVDEIGNEDLPKFTYMPQNINYQNAYVHISLARIADEDCCSSCSGDCLSVSIPCACARETGGEFAYTPQGLLKEEFIRACMSLKRKPQEHHFVYCQNCPLERSKKQQCKGHLVKKFIKECWIKCGCDMQCGNRVVQRGITCKLQVFLTHDSKGWGIRTLQELPKGTFVCEYVGEVLTNTELYKRNMQSSGSERHTYPVTLDADWGSERILRDDEALCLDATSCGNVARFINHRCFDANLIDIPVEVETPDRHYYHIAFFTTRNVSALEELTWDYGIDFSDHNHPVKAFQCCCGSAFCRDGKGKRKSINVMHR